MRRPLIILAALVVLVAAGVAVAYFVVFPTSSPKRFAPSTSAEKPASTSGVAGRWRVAAGSEVGYRVREKLAFLSAQSDAVGRTPAVTGSATVTRAKRVVAITAAAFRADVSQLTSDKSMRDQRIHEIGLESDRYPTATFKLAKPVTLPAAALTGKVVRATATGVFNIHGTSKRETVPLQVRLGNSALEAVGSITFPWSEFGMTAPSVAGFVNVTGKATMEFDLHLKP